MSKNQMPTFFCPQHKTRLRNDEKNLRCEQGCSFPICSGIPRFVQSDNYAAAFGLQWNKYQQTQLDSFYKTSDFKRSPCPPVLANPNGKTLLENRFWRQDAGGAFYEILLAAGAQRSHQYDMSDAVDSQSKSCPQMNYHRIAQADILKLPFVETTIMISFMCLGVISHSPKHRNKQL